MTQVPEGLVLSWEWTDLGLTPAVPAASMPLSRLSLSMEIDQWSNCAIFKAGDLFPSTNWKFPPKVTRKGRWETSGPSWP